MYYVSSAPISSAHVAASPCGLCSRRVLIAGIAIMWDLGFSCCCDIRVLMNGVSPFHFLICGRGIGYIV